MKSDRRARPEPARPEDFEAVVSLVRMSDLPTDGIADAFPGGYSVVRVGETVVGTAGLEAHGDSGLLRSVAVSPGCQGGGLGKLLVHDRLAAAKERRLREVYLLTTTAAPFFRRLGFDQVPRSAVPAEVQASSEFSSVCPATAECLVKKLS